MCFLFNPYTCYGSGMVVTTTVTTIVVITVEFPTRRDVVLLEYVVSLVMPRLVPFMAGVVAFAMVGNCVAVTVVGTIVTGQVSSLRVVFKETQTVALHRITVKQQVTLSPHPSTWPENVVMFTQWLPGIVNPLEYTETQCSS